MTVGTWSAFHSPYSDAEVRKYAPTAAGAYVLLVKTMTGWEYFYVGKADNLESRLLDHLRSAEPNNCITENLKYRCGFMWIEITTEPERSGAEKFLYDKLAPECNQNDPGGRQLVIPLPTRPT